MNSKEEQNLARLEGRVRNGKISDQKCFRFIREMNSYSEERLDRVALVNGKREFTYRQLFRQWDRYGEVFSGMKITGRNGSRVAMIGNISAECIIAFYALNMNGVTVSMMPLEDTYDEERWFNSIRKEGITDLIIAEACAWPKLLSMIYFNKRELELRNIIILPTFVDGPYAAPIERLQARFYEQILKLFPDMERMDDLIKRYEASPFMPVRAIRDDPAIITHTSGTTRGIHKPIPFTDKALNSAAVNMMQYEPFKKFQNGQGISIQTMEMTSAFFMINGIHTPLALGLKLVIVPMGTYNPKFSKAIEDYGVNFLLTASLLFEHWMREECECGKRYDFSSLEFVALGGSYVSEDTLKKINKFIKKHGGHAKAVSGYGLSEAGGACLLPDPEEEISDTIGRPLPGVEVRILDEEDQTFYQLSDGPRTGGLYISTESMSSGRIGDTIYFEPEEIDGKPYICTYDQVEVKEDGSLTYVGRMNRYFVNNEGIRFDAGIIETALSRQPGIEGCAIVPKYSKEIYDTVPVLYVQTCEFGAKSVAKVKKALLAAFADEERFQESSLPAECVITKQIPHNDGGKVDVHRITKGRVPGHTFELKGISEDGKLTDIRFISKIREQANMSSDLLEGLGSMFGLC